MTRGVIATDATNLELTRSIVVSDEFVGDDEEVYKIDADDGGLELHCAARVDGENKHPLDATVTEGDTHESPQFDLLKKDVEVFEWRLVRVVLCIDWIHADHMVSPTPPSQGWRGTCHPENPQLLE